jgi:hypothetical protein
MATIITCFLDFVEFVTLVEETSHICELLWQKQHRYMKFIQPAREARRLAP